MRSSDLLTLLGWFIFAYTIYTLTRALYNITLHPLAKYPGPKLYAAFVFPRYWIIWTGDHVATIHTLQYVQSSLYNLYLYKPYASRWIDERPPSSRKMDVRLISKKYGEVVRIGPNTLLFNTSQAFRDIYAKSAKSKNGIPKDPEFYEPKEVPSLAEVDDETHARQRRIFSYAFSEQALREQEPIVHQYTDLLVSKLQAQLTGPTKGKIDLVRWLNFTTFDIIGDLAFAESFEALDKGEYHFWMAAIFENLKIAAWLRCIRQIPPLYTVLVAITKMSPAIAKLKDRLDDDTKDKTMRRIHSKTDRKDLMSHLLTKENDGNHLSNEALIANGGLFIVAGSETSATLLSGMFFLLLTNPDCLSQLRQEIYSSFDSVHDMTFMKEAKLPYLQACIEEALRLYPPVPIELPRKTPLEGATINGEMIPGSTSVGVSHFCAFHSSQNFKDPDSYRPERWLGDPAYVNDDLSTVQPFSMGGRNCIGKNLAYAEMRSIVCRLLWNFDLELCPESKNWLHQKVYFLWEKPTLMVKLTPRT